VLHNKVGEQKSYNQFGHFKLLLVASALFSILNAQSFSDFKRSQSDSFTSYKDEKDKTFNNYLKSSWEAYSSKKPISLYEKPKPVEITRARHRNIKKIGPKVNIKIKKDDSINKNVEISKPADMMSDNKDVIFDFFGTSVGFNIPKGMQRSKFYPQNQKGIKNFFDSAAVSDYEYLVDEINKVSNNFNLNDWGKYLLIKKISEKIFLNQDDARLLSWFIFNKLGYSVRVGLANKHVILMHHSKKTIYSTPNYSIDNKKFYVISNYGQGSVGRIFTYKQNYPDSDKAFDLSMETLPNFNEDIKSKLLSFRQYGKKYNINYNYNQNLLDFMSTYPQADYETFFNTPLEENTYKDIALGLKKEINGKRASEAINFVLNFVQNAFKYEVDAQQFGREKVMFAEETLYYDKSDCEDRAILFSYLIKELFSISVVGVKYKDHMATALYIPMNGDSVKVHKKKFVIADPTYLNASIGQSMPRYKPVKPESFIIVKNSTRK